MELLPVSLSLVRFLPSYLPPADWSTWSYLGCCRDKFCELLWVDFVWILGLSISFPLGPGLLFVNDGAAPECCSLWVL